MKKEKEIKKDEEEIVKDEVAAEDSALAEEEAPAKKESKSDSKSVNVVNARGIVMRTYTAEEHGKDFLALAKEFATKKGLLIK